MIRYMVLGLPRSGTAWMANLLSNNGAVCLHESLADYNLAQLDAMPEVAGISETAGVLLPDQINAHPARKVVIIRDLTEINHSMMLQGLPDIPPVAVQMLDKIEAPRIAFHQLFDYDVTATVYEYLTGNTLDERYFNQLKSYNVQNTVMMGRVREILCQC